jgi:hypothetical protein
MGIAKVIVLVAIGFAAGFLSARLVSPGANKEQALASSSAAEDNQNLAGESEYNSQPHQRDEEHSAKPAKTEPVTFAELSAEADRLRLLGPDESAAGWENLTKRVKGSDLSALAKAVLSNYPSAASEDTLWIVFNEFGKQSLDEAWQLLLLVKNPELRNQVGWAVLQSISEKDAGRALGLVGSLPNSGFKTDMRRAVLGSIASRNPDKAFAMEVQQAGEGPDFDPHSILWEWAKRDPESAMAAVSRLNGHAARTAATALVGILASREPQKAWQFALRLPRSSGDYYGDPRYSALSAWGRSDPKAAMDTALALDDAQVKSAAIEDIARNWAEQDFTSALSYITQLGDASARAKGITAMSSASHANRAELFAALQQYGPVGDSYSAANLLREWAKQEPEAAAEALRQMSPGPNREQAVTEFVRGWMSTENARADQVVAWCSALESENARRTATQVAFEELSKQNAKAAAKLVTALPAAQQEVATLGIAQGWGASEPASAATWALSLPEGPRENALNSVITEWARRSPRDAAAFAQTHDNRGDLVSAVANEWIPYAPEQAAAWVDRLPVGQIRDTGLTRVAEIIGREDPSAAALWAQRISLPETREEQLRNICYQWLQIDPPAAKSWIATSPLSAEAKQSLLQR